MLTLTTMKMAEEAHPGLWHSPCCPTDDPFQIQMVLGIVVAVAVAVDDTDDGRRTKQEIASLPSVKGVL